MSSASRALAVAAAAAFLAVAVPGLARADGDPASDFLIGQDVFLPYDDGATAAEAEELTGLVATAAAQGYRIKVALVASRDDLGSVTALWRKPQQYAEFLGQELFFVYKNRLLIVMPNGYGISRKGKPLPPDRKILDRLPPAGKDTAGAAIVAVRRLAAASGIDLQPPKPHGSSANRDRLVIGAVAAAFALVALAVAALRRRRRASNYP